MLKKRFGDKTYMLWLNYNLVVRFGTQTQRKFHNFATSNHLKAGHKNN